MSLSREYTPSVGKRAESPVRSFEFKREADPVKIAAIIEHCVKNAISISMEFDANKPSLVSITVSSSQLDFSTLGGAQAFFSGVENVLKEKQKIENVATAQIYGKAVLLALHAQTRPDDRSSSADD